MKHSNPVFCLFVLFFVLSFSFVPVSADPPVADEPVFTLDKDTTEVPDWTTFTTVMEEYVPPEGLSVDASITPLYPVGVSLYTKTPKFYFSKIPNALKYRLGVYDVYGEAWVYDNYVGVGNCGANYCWLQPSTKLKTFAYPPESRGTYRWQVAAYTGTEWIVSGNANYFSVLSLSFNSTFDENTKKWIPLAGTWKLTDAGNYKTQGVVGQGATALHSEYFKGDFVYEIKLKRKDTMEVNWIYWNGIPEPLENYYEWDQGYGLIFFNTSEIYLYKYANGASTYLTGFSGFTNPYDWNTFAIWHHGTQWLIYVNDIFAGSVTDTSYSGGWVGVSMNQSAIDKTPLLIDYARVYYSSIGPLNVQYPDGSVFDPATTWPSGQPPANAVLDNKRIR